MNNRAQSTAIETARDPELASDAQALPLSGDDPVTVYVRVTSDVAEFSSDGQTWVPKQMSWQCGDEYALYITYVLTTAGIELTPKATQPKLWFSPVLPPAAPGGQPTQLGCIPPVTGTFHFRVELPDLAGVPRHYIDPKIIVTPITAGGGCEDGRDRATD